MFAADYPFMDIFWTILIFFVWVAWFMLLFRVFGDIFRSHDLSGWAKAAWLIFVILVPFLGVFVYLIANGHGMSERSVQDAQARQAQFAEYVQTTAGSAGPAQEIEKAQGLLDSGTITPAEFGTLKAKALA